jgi:hypothetical protein
MKHMKATVILILLSLALTSLFFIGCEPMNDNTTGDPRDQYVGEWLFNESFKSTESQSYIVKITLDPFNSSQVILGNLGNPGLADITVKGTVTSGQIIVTKQRMSNGWDIEGSGQMSNVANTSMSWTYSLWTGGDKVDYIATALLQ